MHWIEYWYIVNLIGPYVYDIPTPGEVSDFLLTPTTAPFVMDSGALIQAL